MQTLFPEIEPYATHRFPVTPPHVLHVEECGNPHGLPVLFLHGGPGAGFQAWNRRFFDPKRYRIVLFDQRGAGRSTPHAHLEDNTTPALIADIEALREFLGIEQWVVFGGSWGSTLALAYAEAFPARVTGLILRGIFLCRDQDIRWFYQDGASHVYPDYWADYVRVIPEHERHDFLSAYYKRLTGDDELARMAAAKAWSVWEGVCATLRPNHSVVEHFSDPHVALALARIEAHYFVNRIFLEHNQLLDEARRLAGIPGVIVHGRYDMICPLDNAFALHEAWPEAQLQIVPDAGHSAAEPGIIDALVRATNDFARRFGPR
ncbi:MAG: proline iminopeptidase [Moraxellaceae bacterium]|jgi:proline iminopeptidase|nr:proline iminopeptidase [Moraxellaceae bacterium]